MVNPAAILSLLLAMLLALAPSPCFCPTTANAAAGSVCCPVAPIQHGFCPLCDSEATQAAQDQSLAAADSPNTDNGPQGCNRCGLHCSCRQAPSMVAQTPPALPAFAPIALPMVFSFQMLLIRPDPGIRQERLAALAPARPVVTLLRLQCALTT